MSLIMYDAIAVGNIPQNATAAAGYVDGMWPTLLELKARLPHAHVLSIAVFAADDADCLDVEQGDATPAEAPGWVLRQQDRGAYRPAVYTSVSNVPAVLSALGAAGIPRSGVRIWSAHYTGITHICGPSTCAYPGLTINCDATQFTDVSHGLPLDASLVSGTFFDGPPKPPAPQTFIPQGDGVFFLPNGSGAVAALPVPRFVLGAGPAGTPAIVAPTVLRLASNSPAQQEYMVDDSGSWLPLNIDYTRSPEELQIGAASVIKIRRTDAGTNLVTGDFA
jgi:hypothetical protein